MPLLTKEERETLSPEQRRALRKERRKEKRKNRGPILGIKMDKVKELAENLILEIAEDVLPENEQKMDEVIEEFVDRADEFVTWEGVFPPIKTILEAVDGPIIKAVIMAFARPFLQSVFDKLREEGRV